MKTITLCLPDSVYDKFEQISEYYGLPIDMLAQKSLIDRTDEQYETVVIADKKLKESRHDGD